MKGQRTKHKLIKELRLQRGERRIRKLKQQIKYSGKNKMCRNTRIPGKF